MYGALRSDLHEETRFNAMLLILANLGLTLSSPENWGSIMQLELVQNMGELSGLASAAYVEWYHNPARTCLQNLVEDAY